MKILWASLINFRQVPVLKFATDFTIFSKIISPVEALETTICNIQNQFGYFDFKKVLENELKWPL